MEIELGIEPRDDRRTTGLLGIILENHVDFAKPYYDEGNVPLRLHDRVRWEYGLIRKWSNDSNVVQTWLDEAIRRAQHYRSTPNIKTLLTLKAFNWNDAIDTPWTVLSQLLDHE